jgi:hypothetical protein
MALLLLRFPMVVFTLAADLDGPALDLFSSRKPRPRSRQFNKPSIAARKTAAARFGVLSLNIALFT